jgi:hypothetical protein
MISGRRRREGEIVTLLCGKKFSLFSPQDEEEEQEAEAARGRRGEIYSRAM